jgi:hypothetical protein
MDNFHMCANGEYTQCQCNCSLCRGEYKTTEINITQHGYVECDWAAMAAANYIYKKSSIDNDDDSNKEYGITIYKKGDRFYLTEMKLGLNGQIEPDNRIGRDGYTYVAHVHSHPQRDTSGQTFSLSDYIAYYKTRVISNRLNGITGYLVSHIKDIEFIKSNNCVLEKAQYCNTCLINTESKPDARKECGECREQCKKCEKIESENRVGKSPIRCVNGVLMKFTPPPANKTKLLPKIGDAISGIPKGCKIVDYREGQGDEKLIKWNDANSGNTPTMECLTSRQQRRRLFRTHVEVTVINTEFTFDWVLGKYIVFPGR